MMSLIGVQLHTASHIQRKGQIPLSEMDSINGTIQGKGPFEPVDRNDYSWHTTYIERWRVQWIGM